MPLEVLSRKQAFLPLMVSGIPQRDAKRSDCAACYPLEAAPSGVHHKPMCNVYRLNSAAAEIASMFARDIERGANFADEVYPGYRGLVACQGTLRAMTWGFPLVLKSKKTGAPLNPKPVNNARDDKLGTAFWSDSIVNRRCLIPVGRWAEADGEAGRMTRTWYSLPDQEMFAVAGIWRRTEEWGEAYSMVMVDGCDQIAHVNDRMPTILARDDWERWSEGTVQEAFALCRTWTGGLVVEPTTEPWVQARSTLTRPTDAPLLL
jgi:putative SOS response-associated peptidase YedK